MPHLSFTKYHASGNDAVLFFDPEGEVTLSSTRVKALCDRHSGIGADGVIRAVKSRAVPEGAAILAEEPEAEWFLDFWGADGSPQDMNGNAVRVLVHALIEAGHISPGRRDTVPVGTRSGVRDVLAGVSGYTVDLGRWRLADEFLVNARGLHVSRPGQGIELGGFHVVTALSDDAKLEALNLADSPELGPLPEGDTSVEFVVPEDPFIKDGVARIRMRVHDRMGAETLSSGTGAAAAALAFRHWGGDQMPHSWSVETPGGRLAVRMFATEEGEHVSLSGPVELVFRGSIELPV